MATTLASCASCPGSLVSTFESQACVGKRSGFHPVSVALPSSRAGITGSSVVQLQARLRFFQKHDGNGRKQASQITCIAVSEELALEKEEAIVPIAESSPLTPFTPEVHQLLMELCDETSVAELQLKVGSFRLNVKRDVGRIKSAAVAAPVAPPPVPSKPMVDSLPPAPAPATPKTSTASGLISSLSKPLSSTWALLESAADEGLLFVKSPKVGYFRKGRVAKGKSGPPLVDEGQVIKEGHVVCYLEQLGTQQPVESNISGEVVKVLWDDGEPVGFGDPLIAIRPSFPGIKRLT
ncbi:unnamed protein product [Calypogeia fissa]